MTGADQSGRLATGDETATADAADVDKSITLYAVYRNASGATTNDTVNVIVRQ